MSKTKFTEGEWVAEYCTKIPRHDEDTGYKQLGLSIPYKPVCPVEEHEANVRLMAAAPELYEALEAFLKWTSEWALAEGKGIQMQDDIVSAARAALAKARGE
jgi:hypothetical protein